MNQLRRMMVGIMAAMLAAVPAVAQVAGAAIEQDKPLEIASDKLDVFQNENRAVFSGNVIAVQGTTTMRSATMIVFYRDSGSKAEATPAPAAVSTPQGIYRIEAETGVVFTTPTETALGDRAIYNVDTDTIDLYGDNVTLTRGQNILKGTKLNYNMATGRSVLTGGATATGKPPRVHGLFVPTSDKPKAGQ